MNLKPVILVLTMATNAIAFEQIFAVNTGGRAHTDADGIVYQEDDFQVTRIIVPQINMGDVPVSDEILYSNAEYLKGDDKVVAYDIPVKSDGLYLLIAKYSQFCDTSNECAQELRLNDFLLHAKNLYRACGEGPNICDYHFYFCVSNQTVFYKNRSSRIRNEKIHIRAIVEDDDEGYISGIVVLKGTLGEHKNLVSSARQKTMYFNPATMHPKCVTDLNVLSAFQHILEEQRQITKTLQSNVDKDNNVTDSCASLSSSFESIKQTNENTETKAALLLKQQSENHNLLQQTMDQHLKKISNLNAIAQTACDNNLMTVLREIQKPDSTDGGYNESSWKNLTDILRQQISTVQTEMKSSIEGVQQANNQIRTEQAQQIDNRFEKLQSELTNQATKTDQAIKNIETLQVDVRQLVEDSQKLQERMKQFFEEMPSLIQETVLKTIEST
jgi:Malectin domain